MTRPLVRNVHCGPRAGIDDPKPTAALYAELTVRMTWTARLPRRSAVSPELQMLRLARMSASPLWGPFIYVNLAAKTWENVLR